MIKSIQVKNLLSFGSEGLNLKLEPLNVLIGPNGTGKSNFIEILSLLQASPTALAQPVRKGGGVSDWLHKGSIDPIAKVESVIDYPYGPENIRHSFEFTSEGGRFTLIDERIENEKAIDNSRIPFFFYKYENNHPILNVKLGKDRRGRRRTLKREDIDPEQSILSQRKDPDTYPEITWLANMYNKIKIYREWTFGRYASPRLRQQADLPNDRLLEDASNLGLVLKKIQMMGGEKDISDGLRELYDGITGFDVAIDGGTVQILLKEWSHYIPATRLSDGTLRYLLLLAILCHPKPPSLICIEEPELGLHPDILPYLAGLLVKASKRTQLVVTTHSEILIDSLSDTPESVLVCEKGVNGTSMRRCSSEELKGWLETYTLGSLWRKGEIGGNRW